MNAAQKDALLSLRIAGRLGIRVFPDDARTLRRAALTLHRWAEAECGDGSGWWIERDEAGLPWRNNGRMRYRIADREAGALRAIARTCAAHGLHFYHQPDPRGCPLYLSTEPLGPDNYTRGLAVEV